MAFLKAVLLGSVKEYGDKNAINPLKKVWKSAFFKVAQSGETFANELGFCGDSVADTKHHGGAEKAVFANSYENYTSWESYLGLSNLPFGAMGENLTISGLDENNVCIGDVHQVGSLVLQVSQPRKPCFKISIRWGNKDFARHIFATGLTGWYYRVLESGSCKAGDEIKLISQDSIQMSVMSVNKLFFDPKNHQNLLDKFFKLTTIANGWQNDIQKRIDGVYDASYMVEL
ncbi:MOSC domain-containing protein [Campylobacter sp. faydin G-24]|uniref:MOSC domain-containing protein n=1 Tax=Campylobacter anatolicus TaxID=2829105 RepID=A0ABS5HIY1_9BACT|nr:MOSC domain-containing protein [Campylobacter anatolicus]MBR8461408.1 MOSC domain-containing protein [Campylobacter anatolicus]MBR8464229.1 MOSC domain-containing protein [Campylobacter anatolicus]MBR8466134.1 MOSC domain-containing protein [Campylobacter anatolicus]